jgi:hypothetical protein
MGFGNMVQFKDDIVQQDRLAFLRQQRPNPARIASSPIPSEQHQRMPIRQSVFWIKPFQCETSDRLMLDIRERRHGPTVNAPIW